MKSSKNIETTITVELNAQDVLAYVQDKQLVPKDWKYYSVEVTGGKVSEGCKLTIKHTERAEVA